MGVIPGDTLAPETIKDTLSLQDVVYGLSYRATAIEKQGGKSGELSRQDQLKVKDLDGANEWLSDYMKKYPQSTIQEAYKTAMGQEMPDDPNETKKWRGARQMLAGYATTSLSKLSQAEQDWMTKARETNNKRQNEATPISSEQDRNNEIDILSDFSDQAKFAFFTSREITGFTSYAKGLSKETTRYLLNNDTVKAEFQVTDETLSSMKVFEAVTIGPCYTRTTKEVVDQTSRNETGLFGRKQEPRKVRVFDHNEVQIDEKTGEQLVEIVYRTTSASNEYFMDEFGRRGNTLIWRAQVPRSLGERIAQRVKEYPHIIRLLIVSSIKTDIQGQKDFNGNIIDFSTDTRGDKYPYYGNGIPPYSQPKWQNSKMYFDQQDFNIPRERDIKLERDTTKETTEQTLRKIVTLSVDKI